MAKYTHCYIKSVICGFYGLSQKCASGITDYHKCYLFHFYSFVFMKYVAILLVFLSGCSVVPRYHQRGFHVSWFSDGRSLGSSLGGIKTTTIRKVNSENLSFNSQEMAGDSKAGFKDSVICFGATQAHPNDALYQAGSRNNRPENHVSSIVQFRQLQTLPKPKPSIFKPQDREDKLESVAFLCYSIGLALLLISWALASEWIFGIGALLLACGAIAVLALGLNNITRAYVGYMTIFTLLGAIYMLARFGWLDDLISAWKP